MSITLPRCSLSPPFQKNKLNIISHLPKHATCLANLIIFNLFLCWLYGLGPLSHVPACCSIHLLRGLPGSLFSFGWYLKARFRACKYAFAATCPNKFCLYLFVILWILVILYSFLISSFRSLYRRENRLTGLKNLTSAASVLFSSRFVVTRVQLPQRKVGRATTSQNFIFFSPPRCLCMSSDRTAHTL
jgi:hypothetical protein